MLRHQRLLLITFFIYISTACGMEKKRTAERAKTKAVVAAQVERSAVDRVDAKGAAAVAESSSKLSAPKSEFAITLEEALAGKMTIPALQNLIGEYGKIDPYKFFQATFTKNTFFQKLDGHGMDMKLTPEGKIFIRYRALAPGGNEIKLAVWSIQDGLKVIDQHNDRGTLGINLANIVAAITYDSVILYNSDGNVVDTLHKEPQVQINRLRISPNNSYVFGYNHEEIYCWNKVHKNFFVIKFSGNNYPPGNTAIFTSDQQFFVAINGHDIISFSLGKEKITYKQISNPGNRHLTALPDGLFATVQKGATLQIWDLASGTVTQKAIPQEKGLCTGLIAGNNNTLIAKTNEGYVLVYDMTAKAFTATLFEPNGHDLQLLTLSDDHLVSYNNFSESMRIWDLTSSTNIATIYGSGSGSKQKINLSSGGKALYVSETCGESNKTIALTKYQLNSAAAEKLYHMDDEHIIQLEFLIHKLTEQTGKLLKAHSKDAIELSKEDAAFYATLPEPVQECLKSNFTIKLFEKSVAKL